MTNPNHIAIIMDGNGRWGKKKFNNRLAGHRKGIENIKSILEFVLLKKINHHETSLKVKAEREVLKVLDGDCETAVGAFSEIKNNEIFISGELFSIDGRRRYYYKVRSEKKKSIEAGKTLGKKLKEQSGGDYKK